MLLIYLGLVVLADVVVADKVIVKGWCESESKKDIFGRTYYTKSHCFIPDVPEGKTPLAKLEKTDGSKSCDGKFSIVKSDGKFYVEVKDGCIGYFAIYVKITGTWGAWGDWSSCDKKCELTRTRTCSTGNVTDCDGSAAEHKHCTDGLCDEIAYDRTQCGRPNPSARVRVVNGHTAGECQFPWMVFLHNDVAGYICGASIIGHRHILTAAHCVVNPITKKVFPASNFKLFSGTSDMSSSNKKRRLNLAEKVLPHDNYVFNTKKIANDIAVIKLADDLKFDDCQRPICLTDGSHEVTDGKNCHVMGWGRVSNSHNNLPDDLQWTHEKAVLKKECHSTWEDLVTHEMFCALGENAGVCNGDSGGPFSCPDANNRFIQYGLVSAGAKNKCGEMYSIYVYLNKYVHWIKEQMHK